LESKEKLELKYCFYVEHIPLISAANIVEIKARNPAATVPIVE
jgi:hypothetical protein